MKFYFITVDARKTERERGRACTFEDANEMYMCLGVIKLKNVVGSVAKQVTGRHNVATNCVIISLHYRLCEREAG